MEYLLIIGLTLLCSWSIIKISNKRRMIFLGKHKYRQSSIYEMVKDVIPKQTFDKPKVITQSQKHIQKNMLRVVITEGKAYWILDNVFYTAELNHGIVDKETTKEVDTMTMNKVQLDKMIFIIDRLREEAFDDRWGSGY